MLRKLTSSRRVPALLSFALLLAMLAPVSASATGNGGGSGGEQYTNRDFDISLRSKWSNDFKSDWLLKPIFLMFREDVVRSRDHISDHVSNDENKRWWGMRHRSGGFAKSHNRWGYRDHGPVVPVVPEPSTAVLMLLGLAGLAVSSHRVRS
jgi:hypothetical protein